MQVRKLICRKKRRYKIQNTTNGKNEAGLVTMAQKAGKVNLLEEKSGRHLKFREYETQEKVFHGNNEQLLIMQ